MLVSIDSDVKRDQLLDVLPRAFTKLDADEQQLSMTIYQQLAAGQPVEYHTLADRLPLSIDKIRRIIAQWTGVYHDNQQRIIGYWGLALSEMPHKLILDYQTLYAWCAWDSLFIPSLLSKKTIVQSVCAESHEPIELMVTPTGIESVTPSTTVMSFIKSKGNPIEDDIINQFCHYVLFFQSADASRKWLAKHPDAFLMTIEDGFALGQRKNSRQYTH